MLTDLFKIVEEHTVGKQFPSTFKQRVQLANVGRFLDAMELIRDYLERQKLAVPDRIRLPSGIAADSKVAQPLQPDINHSTVQHPQTNANVQTSNRQDMPVLQVPTKPPEYLDQAVVKLFEQAQKAASE